MSILTTIVVAIALAMDALAVAVTRGIAMRTLKVGHALKIALFFGAFQAIMPLLGWLAGLSLQSFISEFDHWIAFGLLTAIGCKMIYEAAKSPPPTQEGFRLDLHLLVILSVATSIDALAVGVSLALLRVSIITPIVTIGVVTFILSYVGVYIGSRMGHFFERKMEIMGGLILIGIGVKILIEHLL